MDAAAIREKEKTAKALFGGSLVEIIAGGAALIVAILGLAGMLSEVLLAVAAIAVSVSMLFEGGAIAARFSKLLSETSEGRLDAVKLEAGTSAESVGGVVGLALGILALLGITPLVLVAIAAIVLGGALIVGTGVKTNLNRLEISQTGEQENVEQIAHHALSSAAGVQLLIGLGAVALGILSLVGIEPVVLALVAMLALATSILFSGTAISGRMLNIFHG
jgi:hypothetical protein